MERNRGERRKRNYAVVARRKKIAKRLYTRTHMASIVPVVAQSIKDRITDEQMMEWFVTFFAGKKSATISSTYNFAAGSGSGKKESVKKRLDELEKSYNEYFSNSTEIKEEVA